jgi:Pyridoxamine 5'-phosphate oxidase
MDSAIQHKILQLLDQHRIMTVATLRPDGWPQATTVGYVNKALTLYFLCGPDSQKANNLLRDDRLSLTIDHDTPELMAITGLSMAQIWWSAESAAAQETHPVLAITNAVIRFIACAASGRNGASWNAWGTLGQSSTCTSTPAA